MADRRVGIFLQCRSQEQQEFPIDMKDLHRVIRDGSADIDIGIFGEFTDHGTCQVRVGNDASLRHLTDAGGLLRPFGARYGEWHGARPVCTFASVSIGREKSYRSR